MRNTFSWLGVTGLSLAAGCSQEGWGNFQQARADFQQTADAQGVTLAVVETQNGSVDIHCDAPAGQADIAGSKHAQAASLDVARQRLEQIQIRVEREAGKPHVLHIKAQVPRFTDGSAGASLRLALPPEVAVTVRTSNGGATVIGAGGDVDLETSNGPIHAEAIGGALAARTSNGGIKAAQVAGNVEAISSNGGIDLQEVGRERVHARTSNGRIHATDPRGEVTLVSSNGPAELRAGALPPEPHLHVETSNAPARVDVPRDVRAAVRLTTNNAGVHADLAGAQVTDRTGGANHLSATLNGGGGRIEVVTSNGPVHFTLIEPRPSTAEAPATSPAGDDR